MKQLQRIPLDVDTRVKQALNYSMQVYANKLISGNIEIGLEAAFKMHLANFIDSWLNLNTLYNEERFNVLLEKNIPICQMNDYIDIVIKYKKDKIEKLYPIEVKFKKESDLAPDLGNIYSYIDIYNLDRHKNNTKNVCGCYFVFLTDYKTYTTPANRGTRKELPMYDGYKILKNKNYTVSGKSAKKNTSKYPNGFMFSNDYEINYQSFSVKSHDYWFYIIEI